MLLRVGRDLNFELLTCPDEPVDFFDNPVIADMLSSSRPTLTSMMEPTPITIVSLSFASDSDAAGTSLSRRTTIFDFASSPFMCSTSSSVPFPAMSSSNAIKLTFDSKVANSGSILGFLLDSNGIQSVWIDSSSDISSNVSDGLSIHEASDSFTTQVDIAPVSVLPSDPSPSASSKNNPLKKSPTSSSCKVELVGISSGLFDTNPDKLNACCFSVCFDVFCVSISRTRS